MNPDSSMSAWQRPKTTKLYVHPPFAERFITLWPDFKIVNGLITDEPVKSYEAFGMLFFVGDPLRHLDWQKTRFITRDDGIPVHHLLHEAGDYRLEMECFCSMTRDPVTYCRVTLTNTSAWPVSDVFSVLPRSGDERYLTEYNWDGYGTYAPGTNTWHMLPTHWRYDSQEGALAEDDRRIAIHHPAALSAAWQAQIEALPLNVRNLLSYSFTLPVGGQATFEFALYNRAPSSLAFDYAAEKARCIAGWQTIFDKVTRQPKTEQPIYHTLYRHLIAQSMQMLCYPAGKDYVLPRQGGVNRGVWPWEACDFLIPLDQIGLSDYTEPAYDYFLSEMQVKDGPKKGKIEHAAVNWGCLTGAVMGGMALHLLQVNDRARFAHYRQALLDGFDWMERTRATTRAPGFSGIGKGLFPPMRAHDWEGDFQSWCATDANNLIGLAHLVNLFQHFDDPQAGRIAAAYADYRAVMEQTLADICAGKEQDAEIMIPHQLGVPFKDPPVWPYFAEVTALFRAGIIQPGSNVFKQVEAYFRNRHFIRAGFTGLMPCSLIEYLPTEHTSGHEWYMVTSDAYWFHAWLACGEVEKARQVFYTVLKFAMSAEFYMLERYADNDPTFTPWQPNASANGRMITMLLAFFDNALSQ
jgi:hypothetical protein